MQKGWNTNRLKIATLLSADEYCLRSWYADIDSRLSAEEKSELKKMLFEDLVN